MPKKITLKPRNAWTMTESWFFSWIRSWLRSRSRFWKPVLLAKQKSRRPYKWENKRQKREYQCNKCKKWFPDKIGKKSQIQIDHIKDCWTLTCFNDLPWFCERLFCEADWLQTLCSNCHDEKSNLSRKK